MLSSSFEKIEKEHPGVLDSVLYPLLDWKDKSNLAKTATVFNKALRFSLLQRALLYVISKGEYESVTRMLLVNPELKDFLLKKQKSFTNDGGLMFKKISPIQYAFWACDARMFRLLLQNLTGDQRINVVEHVHAEIEHDHGITFRFFDHIISSWSGYVAKKKSYLHFNANFWSDFEILLIMTPDISWKNRTLPTHFLRQSKIENNWQDELFNYATIFFYILGVALHLVSQYQENHLHDMRPGLILLNLLTLLRLRITQLPSTMFAKHIHEQEVALHTLKKLVEKNKEELNEMIIELKMSNPNNLVATI